MLRLRMCIVESTVQDDDSPNVSRQNSFTSTTERSDSICFEQVRVGPHQSILGEEMGGATASLVIPTGS